MYSNTMNVEKNITRPDAEKLLPAILAFSTNDVGQRALASLDAHHVPFTAVEIEGNHDPILRVGDDELRGIESIEAHMPEIVLATR